MTARVSDLSVDELRFLIQETVRQTFEELFRDPDSGVDFRPDFKSELTSSLQNAQNGGKLLSAESVAAKLGLKW